MGDIAVTEIEPGIFETKRTERERFQFPDTLADLERVLSAHGSHYFDPSNRRFFGSRIGRHGAVWTKEGEKYRKLCFLFVESVRPPHSAREYCLCRWTPQDPRNVERLLTTVSADKARRRFDRLMKLGEGALLPVEKLASLR